MHWDSRGLLMSDKLWVIVVTGYIIKVVTTHRGCSVVCRRTLSRPTRCRDRTAHRSGQHTHPFATLVSEVGLYRPTYTTRSVTDEADGRHGGPVDDPDTKRRQRGFERELPT